MSSYSMRQARQTHAVDSNPDALKEKKKRKDRRKTRDTNEIRQKFRARRTVVVIVVVAVGVCVLHRSSHLVMLLLSNSTLQILNAVAFGSIEVYTWYLV